MAGASAVARACKGKRERARRRWQRVGMARRWRGQAERNGGAGAVASSDTATGREIVCVKLRVGPIT